MEVSAGRTQGAQIQRACSAFIQGLGGFPPAAGFNNHTHLGMASAATFWKVSVATTLVFQKSWHPQASAQPARQWRWNQKPSKGKHRIPGRAEQIWAGLMVHLLSRGIILSLRLKVGWQLGERSIKMVLCSACDREEPRRLSLRL